jgi:hypothetical protein
MKLKKTFPIMVLILVFSVVSAFGAQPIKKLQASKTLPPEVQQAEKMAKERIPNPPAQRASLQDLGRKKMKRVPKTPPPEVQQAEKMAKERIPNPPTQRSSVQDLGRKKMKRTSKTPPPEAIEAEKIARERVTHSRQKRLSVSELKEKLKSTPQGREKLEMINKGQRPTSLLETEKGFSLTWLNPFNVSEAQAGVFSVTLDNTNSFSARPSAFAYMYNVTLYDGANSRQWPIINRSSSNNGRVMIIASIPTEGWYLINILAGYQGQARLEHPSERGIIEIIETWDFTNSPYSTNDYLTVQYLSPGTHYFYFKPEFNRYSMQQIWRITIDSFN